MASLTKAQLAAQLEALRVEREQLLNTIAQRDARIAELTERVDGVNEYAHTAFKRMAAELGLNPEEFDTLDDFVEAVKTVKAEVTSRDEEIGRLRSILVKLHHAAEAAPRRATRQVYEFDPNVRGDFVRASALAKANNGIVRRIGS